MIVTGQPVVEWVAHKTNDFGNFGCAVGIGWQVGGKIVSGVAYNDFNGPNINAHIATDAPLTKSFLRAIFDYPFNCANVQRITALVGEGNVKSRHLCERFGFIEETRLQGAHQTGDLIVYRMRRNECKWLELKK
jgi:RimJ/RimL family protein N-acetyltransferase